MPLSKENSYPGGFASAVILAGEQEGDGLAGVVHRLNCVFWSAAPLTAHVDHQRLNV